jgi:hypothetical protein
VEPCKEVLEGVFKRDLFLGMPCCLMACNFCSIIEARCCFAISVVSFSGSSKSKLPEATAMRLLRLASHFSANLSIEPWMSEEPEVSFEMFEIVD